MSTSHAMAVMNYAGPTISALIFVLLMSRLPEPTRRTFNAMFVAGASGAYLSGGFGRWELLYPVLALPVAFFGLRSYRFIGIAWLMHAAWDLPHHLWGNPIWPFMPTSSLGCAIFDTLIAIWFLAGAPTLVRRSVPGLEGGLVATKKLRVLSDDLPGFVTRRLEESQKFGPNSGSSGTSQSSQRRKIVTEVDK